MDVSDGLVGDLAKMMAASGTGAMVDAGTVPLSLAAAAAIAADPALRTRALTGGDDYEILLACPPARLPALQGDAEAAEVPLAVIGEVTAGTDVAWSLDGAPLTFASGRFEHF